MKKIYKEGLTFDDVLIVPSYSKVLPREVDLSTKLTNSINLKIPILSAAMDTVTESNLAISLAKIGGMGFIHKNMSFKNQVKEIKKVKEYFSGIINNPKCVNYDTSIKEFINIIDKYKFTGYPVTTKNNKLIGFITKNEIKSVKDLNLKVCNFMIKKDKIFIVNKKNSRKEILIKMHKNKIKQAIFVDDNCYLTGYITLNSIKNKEEKNYCIDENGKLRVGIAININNSFEKKIDKLIKENIDAILIDSSHGHSKKILTLISKIRKKYPDLQIIGGNVATKSGALSLVKAGVNAVKVGIGPGSICTTRIITGVGVPQITAILNISNALKKTNITVISDGGIRYSGDISKAIVAGADCVMIGSLFAGSKESPGKIKIYNGKRYKYYRGMGSLSAMYKGSYDRYFYSKKKFSTKLVPEGVESIVPYNGSIKEIIYQQMGGLRSCMGLTGNNTINLLKKKGKFIKSSNASLNESHVHDVNIIKNSPNYKKY